MQPTLTFQLDGPTGNLQVLKSGLLIAELSVDDQVNLLIQVAHAHMVRQEHIRVNSQPPQPFADASPVLRSIVNPTA